MRKLLYTATAICGLAGPAMALPAITGDINFDGNVIYTSSTVSFVGNEGVSSGTGTLADFGTCNGCISATSITLFAIRGTDKQLPLRHQRRRSASPSICCRCSMCSLFRPTIWTLTARRCCT